MLGSWTWRKLKTLCCKLPFYRLKSYASFFTGDLCVHAWMCIICVHTGMCICFSYMRRPENMQYTCTSMPGHAVGCHAIACCTVRCIHHSILYRIISRRTIPQSKHKTLYMRINHRSTGRCTQQTRNLKS